MNRLLTILMRVGQWGPLKILIGWPLLAVLILKQKVDAHYFDLLSDVEKREAMVRWAKACGCDTVVETGTWHGHTAEYVSQHVKRYFTIELDKTLANAAREKFKGVKNLTVLQGDSGTWLKLLLDDETFESGERVLFYLDAHYCAADTAGRGENPPIITEIETILKAKVEHIIMIDDARCYLGYDGYPSIRTLRKLVNRLKPHYELRVSQDLIKIYNPRIHDHARRW